MLRNKYSIRLVPGILLVLAFPALGKTEEIALKALPKTKQGVEGVWVSRYVTHLSSDTMAFTFAKQPQGNLVATIDFPERRKQQKFRVVTVKDRTVQIKEFGLSLIFEAQVSADGSYLEGKVLIGGVWRPVKLTRVDEMPGLRRPQEPTRPYPYDEEEVSFRNDKANIRLAGTLTLPRETRTPHPAVLLMSGSGPDDRDCLSAGHYRFLVLADYLTRRGIAVLRVDDRGVGKSTGVFSKATTEDLVGDAQAAVEYLKQRKDIDPKRIGLIGHSDGANGAALLAARAPEIAFVVMLGGPGVPGEQIVLRQTELGLKALGANEHLTQWNVNVQQRIIDVLKQEPDAASADKALRQLYAEVNAGLTDEGRKRMGVSNTFQINCQVGSTTWLRYFVTYDPRPTLAKIRCPVLALGGDKDLIVWSRDNLPEIEKALQAGGNKDYTVTELRGLNHMFQSCRIGAPFEYFLIEETIAPAALEVVGDWIAKRTGRGR